MTVTRGSTRGKRLPPEQRRAHLIDAAIAVFGRLPVDQVSADDIAAEAGVSRALFYRYFSSAAEAFVAATETAVDGLVERLTTPSEGTLAEQLRTALGEFLRFAETHEPSVVALLRNGSVMATPDTTALIDRVRRTAVDEILARAGVTEPSAMTLMTLRSWVATVEVGTLSWLRERHLTAAELAAWLTDQFIAMSAATAAHDASMAGVADR
ncbi:TetR/AcrR family transcriptional regulator [Amycolatopsis sp. CA-230715]|uniref:TetR/AcrR family transcriptional regulator n=1 Tax=Amycolatopsis sp. CA-230715 TaxID=2745196 RepID=UPI001C010D31|nr:TetR/AcrR family transcriptional regulator [Amycolatopsis sp. CA-230715]